MSVKFAQKQAASYEALILTRNENKPKQSRDNSRLSERVGHSKVIRANEGFKYVGEISVKRKQNKIVIK